MITRFLYDKIIEEVKESNFNFRILKYDLPYLIYLNLPKIFSIFIIFIIKHNSKRKSDVNENNMERKYHIFVKSSNNKKFFLIIFIISFLEVIGNVGDHLLYYYQKIHMNPEDEPHRLGWLVEKKKLLYHFCSIVLLFIFKE
jgi:Na+/melibiose symporter-like transporter